MGMSLSAEIWHGIPISEDKLEGLLNDPEIFKAVYESGDFEQERLASHELEAYLEGRFQLRDSGVFIGSANYYDDSLLYLYVISQTSYCGEPTNISETINQKLPEVALVKLREVCTFLGIEGDLCWHISASYF